MERCIYMILPVDETYICLEEGKKRTWMCVWMLFHFHELVVGKYATVVDIHSQAKQATSRRRGGGSDEIEGRGRGGGGHASVKRRTPWDRRS
ncbi:hypothetical protein CRG98_036131 [Punica granatum]|uniref:Uncharacterized protein n=1 Tax=Punica granatum TaxID=22663 RepID=A0A2I0IHB1_PUNGR|nr:hypothetical protein CRG98_036131 [Punica granatum]